MLMLVNVVPLLENLTNEERNYGLKLVFEIGNSWYLVILDHEIHNLRPENTILRPQNVNEKSKKINEWATIYNVISEVVCRDL